MIINLFPAGKIPPAHIGTWSYTVDVYDWYKYLIIRFDLDSSLIQSGVNCTITSVMTSSGTELRGSVTSNESYSTFGYTWTSTTDVVLTCTVTHGTDTDTEDITIAAS